MPITITADAATELPETLRSQAKEVDGKFVLDSLPEGFGLDNVAATRGKLTKVEQDLKRRDERLRGFAKDDKGTLYEPEEFKELLTDYQRLKDAQGKQPNAEELRKQLVAEAEGRYTRKLTEAEKRATDLEKRAIDLDRELDRTTLEATLSSLVAEMRPKEGKADLARILLREKLAIDKAENGRTVRVRTPDGKDWLSGNGPDGYAMPRDYALNALRAQYADLFAGDNESGAGATSTSTGRSRGYTFKRDDLNGKVSDYLALKERAAKEGKTVELVD